MSESFKIIVVELVGPVLLVLSALTWNLFTAFMSIMLILAIVIIDDRGVHNVK